MGNDRILIIDDDPDILTAYRSVLSPEREGKNSSAGKLARLLGKDLVPEPSKALQFQLGFAGQGPDGVQMAAAALEKNQPFAVTFIDIRMPPGFDGMETAARIRSIDPNIEIVIVTAYSDRSREEIVRSVGAPEKLLFLRKPFDPEELIQLALSLTAKWNLARQAEEQHNELQTVLMTTPAAIFTADDKQCITSWNRAAEQITGYPASQVLGHPCILKTISTGKDCENCLLENETASNQPLEVQIVDSQGVSRTLLKNGTCIRDRQGHVLRVVESFWDITARKEAEAALVKSEARFRALVETTSDWVWETDAAGHFTYCSPLCKTIYGYRPEELAGRSLFEVLTHPEDAAEGRKLFNRCVEKGHGFQNIERRSLTKEGGVIHIESSGIPIADEDGRITGFRGIDRDITKRKIVEKEREELEIQYRQSQKLEALGTLAGGIAHDLNNVLTPIMGGTQLSLMQLDPTHPIYNHIKTIEKGAQKAAELIHQILAFSRKQVLSAKPQNLTLLIKDFAAMLRRLISENIRLTFSLEEKLGTIEADKNQMEQILINLVVNARDAVTSGGEIIIETTNRVVKEQDISRMEGKIIPGSYVVMSVSDNGMGIDSALLARIFDPFFTTKEPGKGTGLGLSTVYGIVKQHGGEVKVDTAPGRGTRFDIYFPRSEESFQTGEQILPQTVTGGCETVLLVEDNEDVCEVVRTSLEHYGYRVLEAANGMEAIRIFEELQGEIDLLVTDVVMPAMGGQSLVEYIRRQKPDLPVLFISGHPLDTDVGNLTQKEHDAFIQKPFNPQDLAGIIRRMLGSGKA
jgi:PAS domain S-box-containing protein